MPKIPTYQNQITVNAPVTTTGLQPANAVTAPEQAIGNIGETFGKIGEMVYQRAQQQQDELGKLFGTELENKLIEKNQEGELAIKSSKGIDTLKNYDNLVNNHNDLFDTLSDYLNGGPDELGFGYLGERFRQNMTDSQKKEILGNVEQYNLKRQNAFNDKLATEWQRMKDEGSMKAVEGYTVGLANGTMQLDTSLQELNYRVSSGQLSYTHEQYRAAVQSLTSTALDKAIDDKDVQMIDGILNGKYNANLADDKLINHYRDAATSAKDAYTVNATISEARARFGNDYKSAIKSVLKDESLSMKIRESAVTVLKKYESAFKDQNEEQMKLAYGALQKKLYTDGFLNMEEARTAVLQSGLDPRGEYGTHSFLTEAEHWFNAPEMRQDNPYDDKHTDMGYFSELMAKANNGELKPNSVQAEPYKLGIGHAELINKVINGRFKDVDDYLKREIRDGRNQLLKPMLGSITGFEAYSVRDANKFEAKMMEKLDKAKNADEMKSMLTPGTKDYITQLTIDEARTSMKERVAEEKQKKIEGKKQEGQTIQQYEENKNKPKLTPADEGLKQKAIDKINQWNAVPSNQDRKKVLNDTNIQKTMDYIKGVKTTPQYKYQDLVERYFPKEAQDTARRIMNAESSSDAWAHNYNPDGSKDSGLFQINDKAWVKELIQQKIITKKSDLYDPDTNVKAAAYIYSKKGWTPWKASRGKWGK
jgi:hypothetical protein